MEDLIKGIEWLNIPSALAVSIVGLFLISQVIGKIIEAFGKTAPELLRLTKLIQRKRQEKKETAETLAEVKKLLSDVNSHYSTDNITKRDAWMS